MVGVYDNDEQVKKKKRNVAVCQLAEDFDTSIAGAVTFWKTCIANSTGSFAIRKQYAAHHLLYCAFYFMYA